MGFFFFLVIVVLVREKWKEKKGEMWKGVWLNLHFNFIRLSVSLLVAYLHDLELAV